MTRDVRGLTLASDSRPAGWHGRILETTELGEVGLSENDEAAADQAVDYCSIFLWNATNEGVGA